MDKLKYSLEVYEEYAYITGPLCANSLIILMELCKLEGFTHLKGRDDGQPGFILVKK